jgi:hypothetical protein
MECYDSACNISGKIELLVNRDNFWGSSFLGVEGVKHTLISVADLINNIFKYAMLRSFPFLLKYIYIAIRMWNLEETWGSQSHHAALTLNVNKPDCNA